MKSKFFFIGLLSIFILNTEVAASKDTTKIRLRNINLKKIFLDTHGHDPRLAFDIPDTEKRKFEGESDIYGEMTPEGIKDFVVFIINKLRLNPGTVKFLDIGAGAGRIPMGACALAGFEKCDGVELSTIRYDISQAALQKFLQKYPNLLKPGQVSFFNMDALNYNIRPYHLIWFASLCMPENIMESFRKKFEEELPEGAIVISLLAFELPENSRFEKLGLIPIQQSWDKKSESYVYRLKGDPLPTAGSQDNMNT